MTLRTNGVLVPLTDDRGKRLLTEDNFGYEPMPGSIVMTEGQHGTAWQRHFNDEMWHSTVGRQVVRWEQLLERRSVVLVYDAPKRRDG